jgi:diadenylate cyclase
MLLEIILNQIKAMDLALNWTNVIEVAMITGFLLLFYRKFIKDTHSEKFVKGLFILVFLWIFSEILIRLDLKILGVFLKSIVTLVSLSLIVIFQPELRRFLGFLGQADFFSRMFNVKTGRKKDDRIDVVKEVVESVKDLSKAHRGALIVFQDDLSHTYADIGKRLNADLSKELILTIFHPNTPLHDGAVIVSGTKVLSAGVLLPLTEDPKLSWKYGTRHRAAIGLSEVSDSAALVISEETGDVSIAMGGELKKYEDLVTLKSDLESILGVKSAEEDENKPVFNINNLIKNKNSTEKKELV